MLLDVQKHVASDNTNPFYFWVLVRKSVEQISITDIAHYTFLTLLSSTAEFKAFS